MIYIFIVIYIYSHAHARSLSLSLSLSGRWSFFQVSLPYIYPSGKASAGPTGEITLQTHTERVVKAESGPIPTHKAPQELKGGNAKNGVRGDKKQGTESKPKDTEKLPSA